MLLDWLKFLSENKVAITGATVTICEVIVIIWNCRRKLRAQQEPKVMILGGPYPTFSEVFWWSANPINLFRKP